MTINDTTQQFIKTLTDNFLNTLTQQVHQKVVIDISNQMQALDVSGLITDKISQAVDTAVNTYTMPDNAIGVKVNNVIDAVTGQFKNSTNLFLDTLTNSVQQKILNELAAVLKHIDTYIPYPILFIIRKSGSSKAAISYKETTARNQVRM